MFRLGLFCLQAAVTTVHPNNFDETQTSQRLTLMGGRQSHSSRCRPPSYARVVRGGRVQAKTRMRVCKIKIRMVANRIDPIAAHETQRHKSGDQKPALRSRNAIRKIDHFENSRSFALDDNTRGNSGRFYFADEHIYNSRLSGVEDVFGERGSKTSATSAATYAADRHSSYSVSSPLAVSLIRPPALIGNPLDWTETMRPPSPILAQGPVSARWRQNG